MASLNQLMTVLNHVLGNDQIEPSNVHLPPANDQPEAANIQFPCSST